MADGAPLPGHGARRLAAVRALHVLDSAPEAVFDQIVRLAADLCAAPVALLSVIDATRQWIKAGTGVPGLTGLERAEAVCAQVLHAEGVVEVDDDIAHDPRLAPCPPGRAPAAPRHYAAAPITLAGGCTVGALCVIAAAPRRLDALQRHALSGLAALAATALTQRQRHPAPNREPTPGVTDRDALNRQLYEATPAMLHSIDPQGRLLAVSDLWLDRLGYARHEVIGRRSVDFLTPASRERAVAAVMPAFFASGRALGIDYQMVRKDGTVIDVLMSAVLERDAQGAPRRSFAVTEDVTERRATAAALAETARMLQLVLDNLPARISYWDSASRNRFANKAFLDDFRTTPQASSGRHAREVLGADWYARLRTPIDDGLAGRPGRLEVSVTAGGAARDLDLRFTPDLRDGLVHGLFVFAIDITARREAERGLAEREMRFKLLVDGVRDYAIYMLDAQGHVATWNTGAERNKGYRADEAIGRHFSLFFTAEDVAAGKPERELAQAAAVGRFEAEDWRQRADGSRFWAGVVLSAIRDEAGQLLGFAKITRDMTERRRQQAATEAALAEKETLLKEVYHRVKNNLQVVQSLLQLRSHTLTDGAARAAIDDSVQRVRAMALVHEKLYQSGGLAAVPLPGYVGDLLAQLAEANGADRRRVQLSADIAPLQTGLDSAVPLGLLLAELVSNALKHGFGGRHGGTIRVSLRREEGGALLRVVDDGVGFPPGFDAAAQTASLGLQLAASLARQLGAELHAGNAADGAGGAVISALLTRL